MKKKIIFLTSAGFLLMAPAVYLAAQQPATEQNVPAQNDRQITREVHKAFRADKDLSVFVVRVKTDNGMVTLVGAVPNEKLKAAFEAKAKAQPGVKEVQNKIEVKTDAVPQQ